MKTGYGWYKSHGRCYHITKCENCEASVQATGKQRHADESWLSYLDANIPCCKKPDHLFGYLTPE